MTAAQALISKARASVGAQAPLQLIPVEADPAVGIVLGTIERRYGLLTCAEPVTVASVLERSGDLAVADRLAWLHTQRTHAQHVVFEHEGWYVVGCLERPLTADQADHVTPLALSPRLMSVVTDRGIVPVVGPLV